MNHDPATLSSPAEPGQPALPRFPVVYVDLPSNDVDEASLLLFELGASGVEERDSGTLIASERPGCSTLVASFVDFALAEEAARSMPEAWHARAEELVGDAWRDGYKKHFVPFAITPRIIIRPPWQAYDEPVLPGQVVLELEPGRAFGTGLHATTALVARAIEERLERLRGRDVLDVGTGSGILGLIALALGAERVRAVDTDPEAVAVARENAERNGFAARFQVDTMSLEDIVRGAALFDLVCANIETRVLVELAGLLRAALRPSGRLVLSGILVEQQATIESAYQPLVIEQASREGDWVALVLSAAGARGL